jgi:hypothetical protein
MQYRNLAATSRPTPRSAVRATLHAMAVTAALFASVPASAQDLPSRPIGWLSPLPAPPAAVYEAGPVPEASGSFLKGRFMIGVTTSDHLTPDKNLGSGWSISPVFRNTPRRVGWGPSFGLSGYSGDIVVPIEGKRTTVGQVKILPVMAGIAYSIGGGRLRASFGLVGGYEFSSAKVTAELPSGTTASIDISDSWVVRPNVGLT